jgi:fructuronate reductase
VRRIVHLGLGAFHRAHQAVYTEDAGGWEITGVAQRSRATIDALRAQGHRYTVLERGPEEDRARVIDAVTDTLHAPSESERLTELIASPDTHVVTLTVTEAAYVPGSAPVAQLAKGLAARRRGAPIAVVSCDNVPRNGEVLRDLAGELCDTAEVDFPSTMVDRIVPAATDADRDIAARLTGLSEAPVVGEPFTQWVIEDAFRGERPAWEDAGALLVTDTRPYELMKLRLLNAAHSALAQLGLDAGHETIAEAVGDARLRAFVAELLEQELAPTVGEVPGIDLAEYRASLFERWANPRIAHRLEQIATGAEQKLALRLVPPARELLAEGREPLRIARVIAAWARARHMDAGAALAALGGNDSDPLRALVRDAL